MSDKLDNIFNNKEIRKELIDYTEVLNNYSDLDFSKKEYLTIKEIVPRLGVSKEAIRNAITNNLEEFKEVGSIITKKTEKSFYKINNKGYLLLAILLKTSVVGAMIRNDILKIYLSKEKEFNKSEEINNKNDKVVPVIDNIQKEIKPKEIELKKDNDQEDKSNNEINIITEKIKIIQIKYGLIKCKLYGIEDHKAKCLIQNAIMDNLNIDEIILKELKNEYQKNIIDKKNLTREKIEYAGSNYFKDIASAYHHVAEQLKFRMGINIEKERAKYKYNSKVMPSYLDIIAQNNAFDCVDKILKDYYTEDAINKAF